MHLDPPKGEWMQLSSKSFGVIFFACFILVGIPARVWAQESSVAANITTAAVTEPPEAASDVALPDAPDQQKKRGAASTTTLQAGNISGTVTDTNGDLVPGASVVLEGSVPAAACLGECAERENMPHRSQAYLKRKMPPDPDRERSPSSSSGTSTPL